MKRMRSSGPRGTDTPGRAAGAPTSSAKNLPYVPDLPLVEVDVDADPFPHWIRDITERWNVRVRIEVCRPMGADGSNMVQAVEIIGDPGDLGAAERHLRHRSDIQALTVIPLSPTRRFVRVLTPLPAPCRRIFEEGAICGTCRFVAPGPGGQKARWTLVVPRTEAALRAMAKAGSDPAGAPASIVRMRRFAPARTLTPRQAMAIETAYRLGFYAFPRRTNLREISRILGVTRATAAEILRRAESRLLADELREP